MLLWSVVPTVVKYTIHKEDLQCNHSLLWNKILLFLPKISDYTDSRGVHSERDSFVLSSSSYHASFFFFHLTLMLIPHAPFKGQRLSFCIPSYIVLSLLMRMLLISFTSPYEFHFIFYSVYLCFCLFCLITLFCLWICLLSFLAPLSFLNLLLSLIRTTLSMLYLHTWSWRQHIPSKHWYLSTKQHESSMQKAVIARLVQFVLLFFCFINNPINKTFQSCDGPFYIKVYVISVQGRHDTIPDILLNYL